MTEKIKTVMLIDDEEIDQRNYKRILNRSGRVENIISFNYADEALKFLKENPGQNIDVIFLDINMPRMNGFEFLEEATQELGGDFARMVVVMLTTSINPSDRQRAQANPVVRAFLEKPMVMDHIGFVAGLLNNADAADDNPTS